MVHAIGTEVPQLNETIRSMHLELNEQSMKIFSMERSARESTRQNEATSTELKNSIAELKDLVLLLLGKKSSSSTPPPHQERESTRSSKTIFLS